MGIRNNFNDAILSHVSSIGIPKYKEAILLYKDTISQLGDSHYNDNLIRR